MRHLFSFLVALIISAPAWAAQPTDHELEAAARNFRIATYQTYRTDRIEYDRRIAACTEAVRRFYLANDEQGRVQIRQWFEGVKSGDAQLIADVPQIELAKSPPTSRLSRNRKRDAQAEQRQDGFQVTKYESNPRFKSAYNSHSQDKDTSLVSSENKEVNGVGQLFSNIGKSFLRGKRQSRPESDSPADVDQQLTTGTASATEVITTEPDAYEDLEDPFAPPTEEADATVGAKAEVDQPTEVNADEGIDAESPQQTPANADAQSLDRKILNFNLTVEMLNEDVSAETQKSVDQLVHTVEQLEAADTTFREVSEAQLRLTSQQRDQLTKVASLEDVATEVMTAINELIARQQADVGDVPVEDDSRSTLELLRKRVSKILANHAM